LTRAFPGRTILELAHMMFRGGRVLVLLCFVAASRAATAQPAALPDVLQRAGASVVSFQHQLAGIVAEERYVQDAFVPPQKPLLFSRTEHRKSLPSKGRFWIEPDTGRVLMSELILSATKDGSTSHTSRASPRMAAFASSRSTPTKHS
jgi:hypothetical protein